MDRNVAVTHGHHTWQLACATSQVLFEACSFSVPTSWGIRAHRVTAQLPRAKCSWHLCHPENPGAEAPTSTCPRAGRGQDPSLLDRLGGDPLGTWEGARGPSECSLKGGRQVPSRKVSSAGRMAGLAGVVGAALGGPRWMWGPHSHDTGGGSVGTRGPIVPLGRVLGLDSKEANLCPGRAGS